MSISNQQFIDCLVYNALNIIQMYCQSRISALLRTSPADAGDQRFGPDGRDDEEGLRPRFGLHVLVAGHQIVPLYMVLRVQGVHLVGRLHDLTGRRAGLAGAEAVHGVGEAVVGAVVGADAVLVVAAMRGGTAGPVPGGDQPRVPVHVVGAFALRGGGAGAGPRGGGAGTQAAVLGQAGVRGGARGGARGAGVDVLEARAEVSGGLAAAGRHAGRGPGGEALRVPAGGGVAAGGTQTLGLAVRQAVVAGHRQGGSGADVQGMVLQRVPAMVVMLTRGRDLDPRAQSQTPWPGVVQVVPSLLVLISREDLGVVFEVGGTAGLDTVRGDLFQRVSPVRVWTEDFVRSEVWVIYRREGTRVKNDQNTHERMTKIRHCQYVNREGQIHHSNGRQVRELNNFI